jgi:hypothetical protein
MKDNFMADNQLFKKIAELVELSRRKVIATVNLTMVHTYFEIGKMIVEEQQQGKERAKYGQHILKDLSEKLTAQFGKGFSEQNLRNMRQFFLTYSTDNPSSIRQTASSELGELEKPMNDTSATPIFTLSWSRFYRVGTHKGRPYNSDSDNNLAIKHGRDAIYCVSRNVYAATYGPQRLRLCGWAKLQGLTFGT